MPVRDIIIVGASAGGLQTLTELCVISEGSGGRGLPEFDFFECQPRIWLGRRNAVVLSSIPS